MTAGNDIHMNDRGKIVGCIISRERIADGFSQIAIGVSLSHSFFNRRMQRHTGNVNILPQFHKNNGKTCVLTNGHFFAAGDIGVLDDFLQNLSAA